MIAKIDVLLALMIIVSFLVAIPLHEWSHALVASWLGDNTPRADKRQTLNIRSHIDPVGILLCLTLAFQPVQVSVPVGLGWGRPVKPDPWKMRVGANTGVLLVAIAGPLFSLIVGLVTTMLVRVLLSFVSTAMQHNTLFLRLPQLLIVFAAVNVGIAIFNIIPLYPLDGYQILYTLLPSKQAIQFARSATYGPFIIILLFFFLPFLANLAQMGDFPLFHLGSLIWQGSISLMSLVYGAPFSNSFLILLDLYLLQPGFSFPPGFRIA